MNEFDIPIIKKIYELYKTFHEYRKLINKQDRFTIYEKSESVIIETIECLLEASFLHGKSKVAILEKGSIKLNTLRFFVRLMKDTKSFDNKKYITLQEMIDEIGRMLGGWIKSANI